MSNSTLICLREADGTPNKVLGETGNFTVDLKDKLLHIEDGDSILFKSAFIDTRDQNSGKILIDDSNNSFTIDIGLYLNNVRNVSDPASNQRTYFYAGGNTNTDQPDGNIYVLCENIDNSGAGNLLKITEAKVEFHESDRIARGKIGGFHVCYNALDAKGQPLNVILSYPESTTVGKGVKIQARELEDGISHIFRSTGNLANDLKYDGANSSSFTDNTKNFHRHYGVDNPFDEIKTENAPAGTELDPKIYSLPINLEKGHYQPSDLAKAITDQMIQAVNYPVGTPSTDVLRNKLPLLTNANPTANYGNPLSFPTRSLALTSTKQIALDHNFYGFTNPANIVYVRDDGLACFTQDGADPLNYLVGANQIALEFNEDLEKFQFTSIHSSHYDGTNPAVRFIEVGAGGTGSFISTQTGGIFLSSISGGGMPLFRDVMGFGSNLFCNSFPKTPQNLAGVVGIQTPNFGVFEKGVNITSDLGGIDSAVQKDVDFNAQNGSDIIPTAEALKDQATATIGLTPIIAEIPFSFTEEYNSGYYLIEIDGIPHQDLYNFPNDKIQGVISRYYSAGSYTIMEGGAGGFNYLYKGKRFNVGGLIVKILDPHGNPITQLGSDNTVFLEIVRREEN